MSDRDTSKYIVKDGNKIVYVGITNDLDRRTAEHVADGMQFTNVEKVGNKTTRDAAGNWEADRIQTYMKGHNGETPKYNKNTSGK